MKYAVTVMHQYDTYLGLKIAPKVFSAAEKVATALQTKNINAQEASKQIQVLKSHLESLRNQDTFNKIYMEAKKSGEKFIDAPKLPRRKQIPKRFDTGSGAHQWSTPEEYFRSQFYWIVDLVSSEIDRRFDQEALQILKNIEHLMIDSFSGKDSIEITDKIRDLYKEDINMKRLAAQLGMLPDLLVTYNADRDLPVKTVTTLSTVCEILSSNSSTKHLFSQVHKLLRIYLTIPMSNATAERSFSALRRLKTYLRATMKQTRLNHLMFLHIHKELTDNTDIENVMKKFCSANDRRSNYFGKVH